MSGPDDAALLERLKRAEVLIEELQTANARMQDRRLEALELRVLLLEKPYGDQSSSAPAKPPIGFN